MSIISVEIIIIGHLFFKKDMKTSQKDTENTQKDMVLYENDTDFSIWTCKNRYNPHECWKVLFLPYF